MICPKCGAELVEVDNPMRREVRHKRGVVCKPFTFNPRPLTEHEVELYRKLRAERYPPIQERPFA